VILAKWNPITLIIFVYLRKKNDAKSPHAVVLFFECNNERQRTFLLHQSEKMRRCNTDTSINNVAQSED